jgi:chloride channel 7
LSTFRFFNTELFLVFFLKFLSFYIDTQYLLPIMVAVLIAKWVGDIFSKSIYDELMEQKAIIFLEPKPPRYTSMDRVIHIMHPDVVCIREQESLERVLEVKKKKRCDS